MTGAGWTALAFAIFGAFSYAAGSIFQAVGARRSTSTVRTMGHPLYLLGVGFDLLAWPASIVALRELPVYQVQSILAGSLAITVVAARLFLASRLRRRDVAAVGLTIAALTLLATCAGQQQEHMEPSNALRIGFCAAALAVAVLGWAAAKARLPGMTAALAGTAFGGAALCARALTLPADPAQHLGATVLAIVTEPFTGALLTFAAAGMLLYTSALQHGQVGPVTAILWIGEVVAPSIVGLTLLGDTVRPGWDLWAAGACLATVGAAVLLATAPATSVTAQPAPAEPEAPQPALAPEPATWPSVPVDASWPARRSAAAWPGSPDDAVWPAVRPAALPAGRSAAAWPATQDDAALPGSPGEVDRPAVPAGAGWPAAPAEAGWAATQGDVGWVAAPNGVNQSAARPLWASLVWPEPPGYLPVEPRPSAESQGGAVLWWGPPTNPQPIWVPPARTGEPLPPLIEAQVWSVPTPPEPEPPPRREPSRFPTSRRRSRFRAAPSPR